MTTTWKSLAVGFGAGVVSTGLFAWGFHVPGAIGWGLSLGYVGYQFYEARKGS